MWEGSQHKEQGQAKNRTDTGTVLPRLGTRTQGGGKGSSHSGEKCISLRSNYADKSWRPCLSLNRMAALALAWRLSIHQS